MDRRRAAICYVIEALFTFSFMMSGAQFEVCRAAVGKLIAADRDENPGEECVLTGPNGFPADWRGSVRMEAVQEVLREFEIVDMFRKSQ